MSEENKLSKLTFDELKKAVKNRWPGAVVGDRSKKALPFSTGMSNFDSLFEGGGIPTGQLVEITGGVSSGKTSFLFRILATLTETCTIAYLDFSNSFFPSAAESSGIDIRRVIVVRSLDFRDGLRAAELLLRHRIASCIVFDLVNIKGSLPITMMHRLRAQIVRANSMIIFLTEGGAELIPASMISLRLEVKRKSRADIEVLIVKSRVSNSGFNTELTINE